MVKKIWDFISGLNLTFYSLSALTALFFIGFFYSYFNYSFFEAIDHTPIQDWLIGNISMPWQIWWVAGIMIVLTVLSINTVTCSLSRIKALWTSRGGYGPWTLARLFIPSVIHILFIIMLAGHLLTFSAGSRLRMPIMDGASIPLPDKSTIEVLKISHLNYPKKSLLKDRIAQSTVRFRLLSGGAEKDMTVSFLDPAYTGNYFIHADIEQKKRPDSRVCTKATVINTSRMEPESYLTITKDPGVFIILATFGIMIILMITFYINKNKQNNNI